jgi:amidase
MRFGDLPDIHWAYSYVSYLFCNGIISGYADGTFRPNEGSTRGQFAKMLVLGLRWVPYDPVQPTFSDVRPGSPFYTYVEAAFLHGAISGYGDGKFRPNNPVTRAQAAKMLVLGKGWPLLSPETPSFSDVPTSHWAYDYVETAAAHSVVSGYEDGSFRPNLPVSRAQLSKMVALTVQAAGPPRSGAPRQATASPDQTPAPKEP